MENEKCIDMNLYDDIKIQSYGGYIYCSCLFTWKNNLKKLGFIWDTDFKLWKISENKFTENIYRESRVIRYANRTSIGITYYYNVYYKTKHEINNIAKNIKTVNTKINYKEYLFD